MKQLLGEISSCVICTEHLPLGPRPVVSVHPLNRVLIIGQAPGTKVHRSGIPWDDKSGEQLRSWLGVTPEQFYKSNVFGIVPMGFCYPGRGKGGDLPPRPECALHWHERILSRLPRAELMLLIGSYAQKYYLQNNPYPTLTETVEHFRDYLPRFFPLVHPSPRNGIWQKKNPWFLKEVVPELKGIVSTYL